MNNQHGGISYFDKDVIGRDGFTWNPATGCEGPDGVRCAGCWAERVAKTRLAQAMKAKFDAYEGGDFKEACAIAAKIEAYRTFTPTLHPERLDEPARRKKPAVIGVCFMGDLFDPALNKTMYMGCTMPSHQVLDAMVGAPQHTYILLTKRPEEMFGHLRIVKDLKDGATKGHTRPNWYLGFSARTQAEFDAGWPHMARLAAAGWKVWVSLEPMQGPVNISPSLAHIDTDTGFGDIIESDLSGVILGAQSGKNAVLLNLSWVRSVERQCRAAKIPFMFKQDNSTGKVVTLPELYGRRHTATAWSQP